MSLYSNYKKSMKNLNFQPNKYTIAVFKKKNNFMIETSIETINCYYYKTL